MDSKNKNKNKIAIIVITLIFGAFSIFSTLNLFSNRKDREEELERKDYIEMLEKDLNVELTNDDDFVALNTVGYETVIIPTKYENYLKPCFDFIIEKDGIKITNRLAKEFDDYGFVVGQKIIKINDIELKGKDYFDILDLILCKTYGQTRKFTLEGNVEVEYTYKNTSTKLEYNEELNVLVVYNLDEIAPRAIHEVVLAHPDLTLDLSKATITTYDGMVNFVSLFSLVDQPLFTEPDGVVGQKNRKINNLKITVKDNEDKGVLFALTTIKSLNNTITFDRLNLNTTTFYIVRVLESEEYTIYIKNGLLSNQKSSDSQGGTVL